MTQLGWTPLQIEPIFSMGQDWIVVIQPVPGSASPVYPDGTTVVMNTYTPGEQFGSVDDWNSPTNTWNATIDDADNVIFNVNHTITDDVVEGTVAVIWITYPDTPDPNIYKWAKGTVSRND